MTKIAIIGGSGLEDPKILKDFKEKKVKTPYGAPSSALVCGRIGDTEVVILSRHGKQHQYSPSSVPYRTNIWALKNEGCTHIIAATACGSLREKIKPGDFVLPDQFIDHTKNRVCTFYDDFSKGVAHTAMADPFDKDLREKIVKAAKELGLTKSQLFKIHNGGTVITIEGPRFSTRAESHMFRHWGVDVINMSTVPEVVLANELGIPYQSIAMSTDYDCWKENEEPVTFEMVMERMRDNAEKVKSLIIKTVEGF